MHHRHTTFSAILYIALLAGTVSALVLRQYDIAVFGGMIALWAIFAVFMVIRHALASSDAQIQETLAARPSKQSNARYSVLANNLTLSPQIRAVKNTMITRAPLLILALALCMTIISRTALAAQMTFAVSEDLLRYGWHGVLAFLAMTCFCGAFTHAARAERGFLYSLIAITGIALYAAWTPIVTILTVASFDIVPNIQGIIAISLGIVMLYRQLDRKVTHSDILMYAVTAVIYILDCLAPHAALLALSLSCWGLLGYCYAKAQRLSRQAYMLYQNQ